jgi:two-component system sensor histidine kinase UhpB
MYRSGPRGGPLLGDRGRRLSLLWRIFALNAVLVATAVAVLTFTPLHVHAHTRLSEAMTLLVGMVLILAADLVLLRRALEPLQRESARVALAAQEEERVHLARELHDGVGQVLTAMALRAQVAAEDPATQATALREIARDAIASLDDVRRIARELRPEALDDLGLAGALLALCDRLAHGGPPIERRLEGDLPALTPEAELVLYRVAQEALTNARRHAPGAPVQLGLGRTRAGVVLSVSDRGPGLPSPLPRRGGLVGMRERAMLIGAELEVTSGPGPGVAVTLRVPSRAMAKVGA